MHLGVVAKSWAARARWGFPECCNDEAGENITQKCGYTLEESGMRALERRETQEARGIGQKCYLLFRHTPRTRPRVCAKFRLKTVKVPLEIKVYDESIIREEYWRPSWTS